MSPQLEDIVRKVRSDERIAPAEALVLWHEAPLWLLGELAARRKERVSGDKVYFNRNFHIEPTNLCVFNCNFCSYRRPKGSPEAWDYSLEEVERIARDHAGQGVTEVHIVGGVHPEHDLYYYVEMIRRVKAILPEATVKAFTAIELSYMIRKAGLTIDEGLRLLRSAGMEAIPGGGAEIFDEELRARICPDKGSTAEWFEVHAAAHRLGIDQHPDFFQLLSKFLDIKAYDTIIDIYICPVVEYVQGTGNINFQCCCQPLCFRLVLLAEKIVQVFQNRHLLRNRISQIFLINQSDTTVNNCLLDWFQACFSTYDQLAERKNEV